MRHGRMDEGHSLLTSIACDPERYITWEVRPHFRGCEKVEIDCETIRCSGQTLEFVDVNL